MAIVFGNYSAYLSEVFFVDKGKAYDTEDPVVREMMKRCPDAFGGLPEITPTTPPQIETATAAPGEVRTTGRKPRG